MSRRTSIGGLVDVGLDILSTVVDPTTKRILAQLGNVAKNAVYSGGAEWWQQVGIASRPPNPVAGKAAAQGTVLKTSDRDIVIASVDQRGLDLYGNLGPGETSIYAAGTDGNSQARALFKGDGSISLYTRVGNSPTGAGMLIQLDAMNDAIRITNSKGYGLIIDANGAVLQAGASAGLSLSASGDVSLIGTGKCQIDGGGICLGSNAVAPANSALTGPVGLTAVPSTKVLIATL